MALAETAQLAVNLTLGGNFTAGLGQAESRLAGFNAAAAGAGARTAAVSSAFGSVKTAALGVGGALSHAGNQLKGLITGPLGFLGLTGGLLTIGSVLTGSISKMRDFGETVDKTMGITGLGVEKASALAAALSYVGVQGETVIKSLGMAEKNLFKLAGTAELAADFQKKYGLSVTDTNGKLVDANELLLRSADFYKNNTNRAQVAAAMAAIYGRSWQQLIEVFELGRDKIAAAEETAARLGLTLSGSNLDAILKFRDVTRDMTTAMGGLQLQIGLALLPTLTDLASEITTFVSGHRTDIANFFRNAAQAAKNIAGTIGELAGTVGRFWNSIPPEVRDLLVKGFIADRTIKFLFGFDPIKAIGSALLGGGLGGIFGRGGSPLNPVWVQQVGGPGGLNPLMAAGGILAPGFGTLLLTALAPLVMLDAIPMLFAKTPTQPITTATPAGTIGATGYGGVDFFTGLMPGFKANALRTPSNANQREDRAPNAIATPGFGGFDFEPALYATAGAVRGLAAAIRGLPANLRAGLSSSTSDILKGIRERSAERYGGKGLGESAVRATFQRDMVRWAEQIASSGETQAQKLADIKRVEENLRSAGVQVPARISALEKAIRNQPKPQVDVKFSIAVPVNVRVAAAAGSTVNRAVQLYGGKLVPL